MTPVFSVTKKADKKNTDPITSDSGSEHSESPSASYSIGKLIQPTNSSENTNAANKDNRLETSVWMLAIFAAYFAAGKLGLALAFENQSATIIWAPSGIALAVFLLRGYYMWPCIFLGAFLINITTTGNPFTSFFIAVGNTCEGLLGAYLVNKYAFGRDAFEKVQNIFKFVFLAGIMSTIVSATVGVTSLAIWNLADWDNYLSVWLTWWIGDVVGVVLITPLLLLLVSKDSFEWTQARILEAFTLLLSFILITILEFTSFSYGAINNYPLNYLIIPPFVWLAYRFPKKYVSIAAFGISVVSIIGTLKGFGPFVVDSPNDSLLFLQTFIGTITVMSLCFAAVISQQNKSHNAVIMQYSISHSLAGSNSFHEASQKVLRSICEGLNWELGMIWIVDDAHQVLRPGAWWSSNEIKYRNSGMTDSSRVFQIGRGLPGRVWENGNSAWIPDVTLDSNFPRAPFAIEAGLHAGFAFPVRNGKKVMAVIECFNEKILEPDEDLMKVFNASESQIGNFLVRKLAEEKLAAEYTFRKAVEGSIASGISVTNFDGIQTYINPALCNMLGFDEDELIGKKQPFIYWPGTEIENIQRAFSFSKDGHNATRKFELKLARKNGEIFDALVIITPIINNGNSGLLASITDITEIKKVQKDLQNAHDKMEERVKERTLELDILVKNLEAEVSERKLTEEKLRVTFEKLKATQNELIHSEKLASLGRFSSGIAHEIRNPLANISALAQLLNSANSDPKTREYLEYILINSDIANKIIKELLNFASQHNVNFKESDIRRILNELCDMVKVRCEKNKINLTRKIDHDLPSMILNEEKLQTAFLNFVSNAIEAMPHGGKLIISAGYDDMNKQINISFEDSGIGIKPENKDKILEPFFTTKAEGTGLGMALAYQVITAHSGKINVDSKVNEGTKVTVQLPINSESYI